MVLDVGFILDLVSKSLLRAIAYAWNLGSWFWFMKIRLPSTKFLTPLAGFDFLMVGSPLFGDGISLFSHWNHLVSHTGYSYNLCCSYDLRIVLFDTFWHLVMLLHIIFQFRCACASCFAHVLFYFRCFFVSTYCTPQFHLLYLPSSFPSKKKV